MESSVRLVLHTLKKFLNIENYTVGIYSVGLLVFQPYSWTSKYNKKFN